MVHVSFTNQHAFADEIAGYGDAVVVLSPAGLRDAVVRRLVAAARLGRAPGTRTQDQGNGTTSTEEQRG
ncbi:hypothetical protein DLJ96_02865 [Actinotalea fermentans ATCC 43279 = JCM 9966 = DSM 3133]|nr:hypothetical protein DLJ96_02865 [Actinotalea fermentans ATCC 43279 = JCM 9966 = DSM 3133]